LEKNDEIEFDPIVLSIVDSGFLYAVVHVRGVGLLVEIGIVLEKK
jgi:hypothetical protein